MTLLSQVDTIIMVMLENRSFDHMLGHLSYGPYANGTTVEGLQQYPNPDPEAHYLNSYQGQEYYPRETGDSELTTDLAHESEYVRIQLNYAGGKFRMNGFVEAHFQFPPANLTDDPEPMGFLRPSAVPMTTFLANNFAVCDHWFAPFPTSTQPNKIMALTGDSPIVDSQDGMDMVFGKVKIGKTIFDWLNCPPRKIPWRIYSCGVSFMTLLARNDLIITNDSPDGDHWRPLSAFADDFANEGAATFPKFIFVEPEFGDSPIHLTHHPCDNHPPLSVGFGEEFLRTIYNAITSSVGLAPDRWAKTLMIVTYDEHGGFFDHVEPLPIPYEFKPGSVLPAGESAPYVFRSTGLRVPAIVVSPLVRAQTVCSATLDHTSILQLLAEKWGDATTSFSPTVLARREKGIKSVSDVLNLDDPRPAPPPAAPTDAITPKAQLGAPVGPPSVMQQAYANGARALVEDHPSAAKTALPGLQSWAQQTVAKS
jgi:phospholipase C